MQMIHKVLIVRNGNYDDILIDLENFTCPFQFLK